MHIFSRILQSVWFVGGRCFAMASEEELGTSGSSWGPPPLPPAVWFAYPPILSRTDKLFFDISSDITPPDPGTFPLPCCHQCVSNPVPRLFTDCFFCARLDKAWATFANVSSTLQSSRQ